MLFFVLNSTYLFAQAIDKTKPVGSIDGQANVGSGALAYSIPIQIPRGSNNVQPNISLNYNSLSEDGVAGFGWSISGYSVISRIGQDVFHDGIAKPVKYTNTNDRFQLDGQRLFAVTGINGANNTVYGTEAESFSKIESFGGTETSGPDWFKVTTKAGLVMEFGHETNTKLLTYKKTSAMLWLLSKVSDNNGNYCLYKYAINDNDRNYALTEIDYTGNVGFPEVQH